MRKSWLRYKEDRRSVAVVSLVMSLHVLALFLPWQDMSWLAMGSSAIFQGFLCYICHTINHNHIHIPIFQTKKQNHVFSVILSIAQGLSSKSLIVTHNYNHHVHTADPQDWFHESKAGKGPGLVRLIRYVATVWWIIGQERFKNPKMKLPKHLAQMEVVENLGLLVFSGICLYLNWRAYAFIIFPAWMIASFSITAVNLMQHDGCDADHEFGHSRNYSSRLGNWLFFNGGYHLAHHSKPSVHWSQLPEYHREIEHRIPAGLTDKSMPGIILKKYIFSLS